MRTVAPRKRATRRATRRAEENGRRGAAVWAWSRARRGAAYDETARLDVDQRLRARESPHRGRLASAARGANVESCREVWRGAVWPAAAVWARRHGRRPLARPALAVRAAQRAPEPPEAAIGWGGTKPAGRAHRSGLGEWPANPPKPVRVRERRCRLRRKNQG